MKKLLVFMLIATASCETTQQYPEGWPHRPPRPKDIPSHNCSGRPVYWTWEYQMAYEKGQVYPVLSEDSCLIALIVKVK